MLRVGIPLAVQREALHRQLGAVVAVWRAPDNFPFALDRQPFPSPVERGAAVDFSSGRDDELAIVPYVCGDQTDDRSLQSVGFECDDGFAGNEPAVGSGRGRRYRRNFARSRDDQQRQFARRSGLDDWRSRARSREHRRSHRRRRRPDEPHAFPGECLRQGRRGRRFGRRQGRRGFLLVLPPHGEHAQEEHGSDEHDLAGPRGEKIAVEFHGRGTMTEKFSRTERLARPAGPPAMTR